MQAVLRLYDKALCRLFVRLYIQVPLLVSAELGVRSASDFFLSVIFILCRFLCLCLES